MKKLLSILTTSALTASIPAPLLANTPLTRVKRDVSNLSSKSNNDYIPINKITSIGNNANAASVDSKDNIYFGTDTGAFVLKQGSTTPAKIKDINVKVSSIIIDNNDNIYFGTNNGIYKLVMGSDIATKINGINDIVNAIAVDKNYNIYYVIGRSDGLAFVLKKGKTTSTKINGIRGYVYSVAVDSSNNVYFGTSRGAFVLKHGGTIAKKIDGINDIVNAIAIDSNDNFYCAANEGAFVLKHGGTIAKKIDGIGYWIYSIIIDNSNNIYYGTNNGAFVLKHGESTPTKINGINDIVNAIAVDKNNKIYFGTSNGVKFTTTVLDWLKQQSQFALVESTKNMMWLRDDQLVVNGQVKVKIADTNIDTVKVNTKKMSQTNKVWEFNFPTDSITAENKDYKIEIAFTLDEKSYTGQIIVSSLLAQPSINVKKNTSVIGNVDSYVYQAPTNGKVGDITLTSDLYYSDTEVEVSLNKPTGSTTITALIFGLDEKWDKNKRVFQIFDSQTYNLDGSQLKTYQGRYLIETEDSAGNSSFYYIVLNKDNLTPNFWKTEQGQIFYQWANLNGYNESIKKLNATELNKIIKDSANWQQLSSDSQFVNSVADCFKTNGKLISKEPLTKEQVVEQLKTQIPSSIKIPVVNTSNYDVNKVSFELNQSEFKPNDKVNITVKYNNTTAEQFTLQIKDSKTPDNNKKDGDSKLWIIGVVVGVLAGLGLAYWLFKRFVFDKYFLPKIKKRGHLKLVEKVRKEEAEKDAQNNKGGE